MRPFCRERGCRAGWPFRLLGLVAALLAACSDSPVVNAPAVLKLGAEKLEFPTTFVGHPTQVELEVINGGRAEARFEVVAVQGPFLAEPGGPQRISGTSTQAVKVTFNPPSSGWHVGHLDIVLQDETVRVELRGEGKQPPPCVPTSCVRATFDPTTGECHREVRPDGVPCESENECLVDTVCLDGVCQGSQRDCRPKNACYEASCNPAIGCEEIPVVDSCEQPEDPCKEAICDLETGECVVVDREDYSECGPTNCKEQNVCIGGVCTRIEGQTDGRPCLHACGEGGICLDGECWRPEGRLLSESWQRELPSRHPGLVAAVDLRGYLYWVECPLGEACSLVSVSPNGFERFRQLLSSEIARDSKLLLQGSQIVVWSSAGLQTIQDQGDPGWGRSAEDLGSEVGLSCPCELVDLIDDGDGDLVVLLRWSGGTALRWLSRSQGTGRALVRLAGDARPALASDGEGAVFSIELEGDKSRLVARRKGEVEWAVEVGPTARILAALPSRVFVAHDDSLEARLAKTGSASWTRPHAPLDLVASNQHVFVLEQPGPRLVVLAPSDGEEKASYPLTGIAATSTLALRAEDRAVLLVERGLPTRAWWLEEIDAEGQRTYACELPDARPGRSWAFLPATDVSARLVILNEEESIRTFFAPRLGTPPYGWTAERGSLARAGRPGP